LWIERRKCLLVMHADTAFAVIIIDVHKRDVADPTRLVTSAIATALADEHLPTDTLGPLDQTPTRDNRQPPRPRPHERKGSVSGVVVVEVAERGCSPAATPVIRTVTVAMEADVGHRARRVSGSAQAGAFS
jgi:hypothetical protein